MKLNYSSYLIKKYIRLLKYLSDYLLSHLLVYIIE